MKRTGEQTWWRPRLLPRPRADCEWVQKRMGAFHDWDPCLSDRERRSIGKHVAICPECRADKERTEDLCAAIDKEMVRTDASRLSPEQIASRVMARTDVRESRAGMGAVLDFIGSYRRAVYALIALSGVACAAATLIWVIPHEPASPVPERRLMSTEWVEAALPRDDRELEAWARREYPHVFWVHDVLRENFGYDGAWRDLLVGSAEVFRFDFPKSVGEPNCRPRIQSIEAVARVAGFELEWAPDGQFELPALPWADAGRSPTMRHVRFVRAILDTKSWIPPSDQDEIPRDYERALAKQPALEVSIRLYLSISSQIIGTREFISYADRLLFRRRDGQGVVWGMEERQKPSPNILPSGTIDLLNLRKDLVRSWKAQGWPERGIR